MNGRFETRIPCLHQQQAFVWFDAPSEGVSTQAAQEGIAILHAHRLFDAMVEVVDLAIVIHGCGRKRKQGDLRRPARVRIRSGRLYLFKDLFNAVQ